MNFHQGVYILPKRVKVTRDLSNHSAPFPVSLFSLSPPPFLSSFSLSLSSSHLHTEISDVPKEQAPHQNSSSLSQLDQGDMVVRQEYAAIDTDEEEKGNENRRNPVERRSGLSLCFERDSTKTKIKPLGPCPLLPPVMARYLRILLTIYFKKHP